MQSGGRTLNWKRDTVNVAAFHIPVSASTPSLDLHFQLMTPIAPGMGRIVMTPSIVNVQWDQVSLYPAGYFTRDITVQPSVRVPHGWQIGSALRAATYGDEAHFNATTFNTLVDSPIYAGRYFRKFDLTGPDHVPVSLDVVADDPDSLDATPQQVAAHQNLVRQATSLFGSHHYDHYDFLLALTEELGGIGLEHHQSSENSAAPGYFTEWDKTFPRVICWPMNTPIPGTASIAVRPICGHRTSTRHSVAPCSGCMKDRRSTGAMCLLHVRVS